MSLDLIMGIDPSGNFEEGKGTTGVCLLERGTTTIYQAFQISAKDWGNTMQYWDIHLAMIEQHAPYAVSMEDYLLYADKSEAQINSKFETIQLIGVIKYHCYINEVRLAIRNAGLVKRRWSNDILEHKGYIVRLGKRGWATTTQPKIRLNGHKLDAIRHAVHYDVLENPKEAPYVK